MDKLNLLIADDDSDDKELFIEVINELFPHIHCFTVSDGEETLFFLEKIKDKIDYIFLDINMPRLNGIECLTKIKLFDTYKNTPIIMYTTSCLEADKILAYQNGASYFLTKPVKFLDLKQSLYEIISKFNFKSNPSN